MTSAAPPTTTNPMVTPAIAAALIDALFDGEGVGDGDDNTPWVADCDRVDDAEGNTITLGDAVFDPVCGGVPDADGSEVADAELLGDAPVDRDGVAVDVEVCVLEGVGVGVDEADGGAGVCVAEPESGGGDCVAELERGGGDCVADAERGGGVADGGED